MSTNKKIAFFAIILLVIGSIWYLESIKTRPAEIASNVQPIDVGALTANSSTRSQGAEALSTGTGNVIEPQYVLDSAQRAAIAQLAAADKSAGDQPAIEIQDPTDFVNAPSNFRLSSLIGNHVILLDFWTYSCVNCVRTIPYLNAWYQKYKDEGLVIVGIHTPEFDFEKSLANVQNAVQEYGIQYPVVLDSNQGTWDAYNNLYWPHEYLIDMAGYIVHDHIGEGDYDTTESEIQALLAQRASIIGATGAIPTSTINIAQESLGEIKSPETYFGADRNSLLANGSFFTNGTQSLATPQSTKPNALYLGGTWNFYDQYAESQSINATITYTYDAGKVYMVAAGPPGGVAIQILQDGKPIDTANAGSDVKNGVVEIQANKLYNLVNNADGGAEHTLELIIERPGLEAYTFTFG